MTGFWNPPRGAVKIDHVLYSSAGHMRHVATCSACGWTYSNSVKSDVQWQKSHHRCPAGTRGAYPTCPVCGATGKHCKPSRSWHADRDHIYFAAVDQ